MGLTAAGKSTFIKLLVRELTQTSGKIRHGNFLEITYFDQYRTLLNPEHSIKRILCPNGGDHVHFADGKDMHVASYMKKFMFHPKELDTKVSTLSGRRSPVDCYLRKCWLILAIYSYLMSQQMIWTWIL
ncbi:MAG UNVERIFIED_CONTAM: hypothetical protein LVQ98_01565 [Rickettsiaceae bacterium]